MTKNKNARKGHDAERDYAAIFRELGYEKACTTRLGSRLLDNCKIDIMNVPYNVQIKCGYPKGINPKKIFIKMEELMREHLMEGSIEFKRPKLIIHRYCPGKGIKRLPKHDVAYFYVEDYKQFVEAETLLFNIVKYIPGDKPIVGVFFDHIKNQL